MRVMQIMHSPTPPVTYTYIHTKLCGEVLRVVDVVHCHRPFYHLLCFFIFLRDCFLVQVSSRTSVRYPPFLALTNSHLQHHEPQSFQLHEVHRWLCSCQMCVQHIKERQKNLAGISVK